MGAAPIGGAGNFVGRQLTLGTGAVNADAGAHKLTVVKPVGGTPLVGIFAEPAGGFLPGRNE